jgi:phosphate transport system permease protein
VAKKQKKKAESATSSDIKQITNTPSGALMERSMTFLVAAGLMVVMLMVIAVFAIVIMNGAPYFWPKKVAKIELQDDTAIIGELLNKQKVFEEDYLRQRVKMGNRDVYGRDFTWYEIPDLKGKATYPRDIVMLERWEWGNAYGHIGNQDFKTIKKQIADIQRQKKAAEKFEWNQLVSLHRKVDRLIIKQKQNERAGRSAKIAEIERRLDENELKHEHMIEEAKSKYLTIKVANEDVLEDHTINMYQIVRIYAINQQNWFVKMGIAIGRVFEFVAANPRESNTEGGIFPALYGTIAMVIIMSIIVFPMGIITAIYLHEYAKNGPIVRLIRLTIFNLAGVPSIVFGVFGLGFFVYTVGGFLDTTVFKANLPNPTMGTGGLLWASLTLAVLTLPVVIVASLEGLKSVPQMYREGSYALSSTKWEVIKDVVIPNAMPGMLTGLILAIARAAGEVAPLMLTGVVKHAVNLPIDMSAPFIHFDRKFMHLGFHIYDVGFQSPNIEAARPMVFNTTLILLVVVFALNMVAIVIRNRIKKKLARSGV